MVPAVTWFLRLAWIVFGRLCVITVKKSVPHFHNVLFALRDTLYVAFRGDRRPCVGPSGHPWHT